MSGPEKRHWHDPEDKKLCGRLYEWSDGFCCPTCGSTVFECHPTGHNDYGFHCKICSAMFYDPERFGCAGEQLHGFYVRALQAMERQDTEGDRG